MSSSKASHNTCGGGHITCSCILVYNCFVRVYSTVHTFIRVCNYCTHVYTTIVYSMCTYSYSDSSGHTYVNRQFGGDGEHCECVDEQLECVA